MKTVKFIKRYKIYNAGEIAGFDDKEFQKIVNGGYGLPLEQAEKVEEEKAKEETEKVNPLEEILSNGAKKISEAIENKESVSDTDLQQLIKIETDGKNRSSVKKVIQDEIIKRLEEAAKEANGEGNQDAPNGQDD